MFRYVLQRLVQIVPTLFIISAAVFFLVRLSGDPVQLMLPEDATPAQVEQLRHHLGLDKPILQQFWIFLTNAITGDFGPSIRYPNSAALTVVLERLPATLQLTASALLLAVAVSLPLGIIAAIWHRRAVDYVASTASVIGEAMPGFWIGIMLILVFSVQLGVFPASGRGSPMHIVLPAVTLAASLTAILTRLMRSAMIEVLNNDFIRTAKAKGLPGVAVLLKHALRNSLLSYVTILGLQVASLMAGAVVTEQIFAWPGVGLLAIQAVNTRDMALVQAVLLVTTLIVMFGNLLVDVLYAAIDPRIRY